MGIRDEEREPPRLVKSWDLRALTGKEPRQKVNRNVVTRVPKSSIPTSNLSAFCCKWQLADQRLSEAHDPCVQPGAAPESRKWHRGIRNFPPCFQSRFFFNAVPAQTSEGFSFTIASDFISLPPGSSLCERVDKRTYTRKGWWELEL